MHNAGISHNHTVGRHIEIDKSAGTDHNVVADCDVSNHGCVDADKDAAADGGGTGTFSPVLHTHGGTLVYVYIIAQLNAGADGNVIRMPQIQSFSDGSLGTELQSVLSGKPIALILGQQTAGCFSFPEPVHETNVVAKNEINDGSD